MGIFQVIVVFSIFALALLEWTRQVSNNRAPSVKLDMLASPVPVMDPSQRSVRFPPTTAIHDRGFLVMTR